jgi:hypothetical protein
LKLAVGEKKIALYPFCIGKDDGKRQARKDKQNQETDGKFTPLTVRLGEYGSQEYLFDCIGLFM